MSTLFLAPRAGLSKDELCARLLYAVVLDAPGEVASDSGALQPTSGREAGGLGCLDSRL